MIILRGFDALLANIVVVVIPAATAVIPP